MVATILLAVWVQAGWSQDWKPESFRPVQAEEGVSRVRVVQWNGLPAVMVVGDSGLEIFDPVDGGSVIRMLEGHSGAEVFNPNDEGSVVSIPKSVWDAVILDLDGDERSDLILCGDGLWFWTQAVRKAQKVADWRCDRMELLRVADREEVVVVSGEDSFLMPRGRAEATRIPLEPKMPAGSHLAAAGSAVARWHLDSSDWTLWTSDWSVTVSGKSGIAGVALGPTGWAWLENDTVFDVSGSEFVAVEGASALASDGHLFVAVEPMNNRLRVLRPSAEVVPLPVRPDHLVVGSLDGDNCPDLVAMSQDGHGVRITGSCSKEPARPELALASADVVAIEAEPQAAEDDESNSGPPRLAIRSEWAAVEVEVGESLDLQLYDPTGRAHSFSLRGGPTGLSLEGSQLTYTPVPVDVGLWRVKVRVKEGADAYWTGIDLTVKKAP